MQQNGESIAIATEPKADSRHMSVTSRHMFLDGIGIAAVGMESDDHFHYVRICDGDKVVTLDFARTQDGCMKAARTVAFLGNILSDAFLKDGKVPAW